MNLHRHEQLLEHADMTAQKRGIFDWILVAAGVAFIYAVTWLVLWLIGC